MDGRLSGYHSALEGTATEGVPGQEEKCRPVSATLSGANTISFHAQTGLVIYERRQWTIGWRESPIAFVVLRKPKAAGDLPAYADISTDALSQQLPEKLDDWLEQMENCTTQQLHPTKWCQDQDSNQSYASMNPQESSYGNYPSKWCPWE